MRCLTDSELMFLQRQCRDHTRLADFETHLRSGIGVDPADAVKWSFGNCDDTLLSDIASFIECAVGEGSAWADPKQHAASDHGESQIDLVHAPNAVAPDHGGSSDAKVHPQQLPALSQQPAEQAQPADDNDMNIDAGSLSSLGEDDVASMTSEFHVNTAELDGDFEDEDAPFKYPAPPTSAHPNINHILKSAAEALGSIRIINIDIDMFQSDHKLR